VRRYHVPTGRQVQAGEATIVANREQAAEG